MSNIEIAYFTLTLALFLIGIIISIRVDTPLPLVVSFLFIIIYSAIIDIKYGKEQEIIYSGETYEVKESEIIGGRKMVYALKEGFIVDQKAFEKYSDVIASYTHAEKARVVKTFGFDKDIYVYHPEEQVEE